MDDGAVAQRLAQLALFADLRWPQVEAIAHTFDEAVFAEASASCARAYRRGRSTSSSKEGRRL